MSDAAPEAPSPIGGIRLRTAIIGSLYNDRFVDPMVRTTQEEMQRLLPESEFPILRVPGAYEIPVCAEYLARHAKVDAIVALGVVIRGATPHADLVAESVCGSLQDIATRHVLPVINEVLLLDNEGQAEERCLGNRINRGTEAARAAVNMLELFRKLHTSFPPVHG